MAGLFPFVSFHLPRAFFFTNFLTTLPLAGILPVSAARLHRGAVVGYGGR